MLALSAVRVPSDPERPVTIYVATNEPNGTHHTRELARAAEPRPGVEVVHVVEDRAQVPAAEQDRVTTVRLAMPGPDDVLVVNGAAGSNAVRGKTPTDARVSDGSSFPVECALHEKFAKLPLVASSLAYLPPWPMPEAHKIRDRLVAITATGESEADTFLSAMGLRGHPVEIVGSVHTDDLPPWNPDPPKEGTRGKVLLIGNVIGRTPGAELTYWAACVLRKHDYEVVIRRHPGETLTYPGFAIDDSRGVDAAAKADYIVGGPGSLLGPMAALSYTPPDKPRVGPKIVGIIPPDFGIPDYLRNLCSVWISDDLSTEPMRQARRLAGDEKAPDYEKELVDAMERAGPAGAQAVEDAVGPIGGSADRILDVWVAASHAPVHSVAADDVARVPLTQPANVEQTVVPTQGASQSGRWVRRAPDKGRVPSL